MSPLDGGAEVGRSDGLLGCGEGVDVLVSLGKVGDLIERRLGRPTRAGAIDEELDEALPRREPGRGRHAGADEDDEVPAVIGFGQLVERGIAKRRGGRRRQSRGVRHRCKRGRARWRLGWA